MTDKFVIVRCNSATLDWADASLVDPVTIIWDNNGLYGILSEDVVRNAVQLATDLAKRPKMAPAIKVRFLWSQVVHLPPAAAEALGLKSDRAPSAVSPR
jgi:hypothetical protein